MQQQGPTIRDYNSFLDTRKDPVLNLQREDYASLTSKDYGEAQITADAAIRSQVSGIKKKYESWQGQLPYATTPRQIDPNHTQWIPEDTRVSRVCMNEAIEKSGPFYLRQWPIWDNLPYLPSAGDVNLDPRYAIQTKTFTTEYRHLPK